jgi:hypothetical protein
MLEVTNRYCRISCGLLLRNGEAGWRASVGRQTCSASNPQIDRTSTHTSRTSTTTRRPRLAFRHSFIHQGIPQTFIALPPSNLPSIYPSPNTRARRFIALGLIALGLIERERERESRIKARKNVFRILLTTFGFHWRNIAGREGERGRQYCRSRKDIAWLSKRAHRNWVRRTDPDVAVQGHKIASERGRGNTISNLRTAGI